MKILIFNLIQLFRSQKLFISLDCEKYTWIIRPFQIYKDFFVCITYENAKDWFFFNLVLQKLQILISNLQTIVTIKKKVKS